MFFLRRLFLKDRAGKFRGKILSGRKSGPGRKSGMSDLVSCCMQKTDRMVIHSPYAEVTGVGFVCIR